VHASGFDKSGSGGARPTAWGALLPPSPAKIYRHRLLSPKPPIILDIPGDSPL
jgi:hypothetical protein